MTFEEATKKGVEDTWLPELTDEERESKPDKERIEINNINLRLMKRDAIYGY